MSLHPYKLAIIYELFSFCQALQLISRVSKDALFLSGQTRHPALTA